MMNHLVDQWVQERLVGVCAFVLLGGRDEVLEVLVLLHKPVLEKTVEVFNLRTAISDS